MGWTFTSQIERIVKEKALRPFVGLRAFIPTYFTFSISAKGL